MSTTTIRVLTILLRLFLLFIINRLFPNIMLFLIITSLFLIIIRLFLIIIRSFLINNNIFLNITLFLIIIRSFLVNTNIILILTSLFLILIRLLLMLIKLFLILNRLRTTRPQVTFDSPFSNRNIVGVLAGVTGGREQRQVDKKKKKM